MAAESGRRIAVVGGGIAGSLSALALRSRGFHPVIFDNRKQQLGGRSSDGGAQFFPVTDPSSHLAHVAATLEQSKLIAPWEGRFGILGSSGGGFLAKEVIAAGAGAKRDTALSSVDG
eukprot:384181-Amphidinium_carterae.1